MTILVGAGLVCLMLAGLLFALYGNSNNDGDIGIVVPIVLLILLGVALLVIAAGLSLWQHLSLGWT